MMRVRGSKRKKRRRNRWLIRTIPFLLLIGAGIGIFCYIQSLAFRVCRVEAGVQISASDFMKNKDPQAYFTEESEKFDLTIPGEYRVIVKSGWFQHKCTLIVQDTIAPSGVGVTRQLELGEMPEATELVDAVTDATDVMITFEVLPDYQKIGSQQAVILLKDLGGNETRIVSELNIVPVRSMVEMEAGCSLPPISDFVIQGKDISFVTDVSQIDTTSVQEVDLQIRVDHEIYDTVLKITDTVAPVITTVDVQGYTLIQQEASAFVTVIEDETFVTVSYVDAPDFNVPGVQEVTIKATDAGGNETYAKAYLTLAEDTDAPVITGKQAVTLFIGDTVAYRKLVEVTDNCGEGLVLEVESSQVNLNNAGVYPVTYTAVDLAGNQTQYVVELTVLEREHSIEEVNALADQVLAVIIKENMTPLEKVQAIYNYNMSHIGYISHSEKVDWVKAAYEGLVLGKGDCYVYASTAKLLLTRAGITNMDIEKIPAKTMHYWNLVDIGDGWYHFDTTPRTDHPTIFMWNDAQMMEYSNSHNKSHNYDRELYPVIN